MAQSQADDPAERQAVGRIEHGARQADIFHEVDPALSADLGEGAGRKKVRIGGVQMIVGRVGAPARAEAVAVLSRHARRDRRMIFHHMAVAVDDFVFFVAHGSYLLCHLRLSAISFEWNLGLKVLQLSAER